MRRLATCLPALLIVVVPATSRCADEAGTKSLADDLTAWNRPTQWIPVARTFIDRGDDRKLAFDPGKGVILNGATGRAENLHTQAEFGDVQAHVEFMVPKGSNSGVYFQGRYEVQILDSWGVAKPKYSDCGGIYERWKDEKGYEGRPPKVNASLRQGEWQTFDVTFKAPRFDAAGRKTANAVFAKVVHNGKTIHENVAVTGPTRAAMFDDEKPTGPLMLQGDHGPVAFRNLRIQPLATGK